MLGCLRGRALHWYDQPFHLDIVVLLDHWHFPLWNGHYLWVIFKLAHGYFYPQLSFLKSTNIAPFWRTCLFGADSRKVCQLLLFVIIILIVFSFLMIIRSKYYMLYILYHGQKLINWYTYKFEKSWWLNEVLLIELDDYSN